MNRFFRAITVSLFVCQAVSATGLDAANSPNQDAAVREVVARYWDAYNAGDVETCLGCRAVDAPENDEVRAGLTQMFTSRPPMAGQWIRELSIDHVESAAESAAVRMTAVLPVRDTWPTDFAKQERIVRLVQVDGAWRIHRIVDPTADLGDELLALPDAEVRRQRLRSARKLATPALVEALLARQWSALRRGETLRAETAIAVAREVATTLNHAPTTALCRMTTGIQQVLVGNPQAALDELTAAVQVFEAVKSVAHIPWHAVALVYRGRAYLALQDDAKAQANFEAAQKIFDKIVFAIRRCNRPWGIGEYFLRRLDDRVQLEAQADRQSSAGNFAAAIQTWHQIIELETELFGTVHNDFAGSLRQIAKLSIETGDWNEVVSHAEQELSIRQRLLGDQHWKTADARERLHWMRRLAEATDAERERIQAVERAQKRIPDHRKAGEFREVEGLRRGLVDACREFFGPQSVRTAEALVLWAFALDKLDEDDAAEQRFLEGAQIYNTVYPREHNFWVWCHEETAGFYERQFDILERDRTYARIVDMAEKMVASRQTAHGERHHKTWDAQRKLEHIRRRVALPPDQLTRFHQLQDDWRTALQMKNTPGDATRLELAEKTLQGLESLLGTDDWYCRMAMNVTTFCPGNLPTLIGRQARLERWYLENGAADVNHPDLAHARKMQALYRMQMGRDREAEVGLRQAAELYAASLGRESEEFIATAEMIAVAYNKSADYQAAFDLIQELLAIRLKQVFGDEARGYGLTTRPLQPKDGKFTTAQLNLADLYGELADILVNLSRFSDARMLYEQRRDVIVIASGAESSDHVSVLIRLARCNLVDRGRLTDAESQLRQAWDIAQRLPVKAGSYESPRILNELGRVLYRQGRYEESIATYQQALAGIVQARGADNVDMATVLQNLMLVQQASGQTEEALATALRSLDVDRQYLQQALAFASESSMRAYVDRNGHDVELLMSLLASLPPDKTRTEKVLGWVLRWKGLLLDSLCQVRSLQHAQSGNPQVRQEVERLSAIRRQISDVTLAPFQPSEAAIRARRLADLQTEAGNVEAALHRLLAASRAEPIATDPVDVAALRTRIPKGAVLIEYVRSRPYRFRREPSDPEWSPARYSAFVVSADPALPIRFMDLGETAPIDEAIAALREHVEQTGQLLKSSSESDLEGEYRELAADVHRRIVQPLGDSLADATTVIVSPDGALNRLAFETLVDERGDYLAERRAYAYVSSGRDLLRVREPPGTGTLVFAGPDFDLSNVERTKEIAAVETREASQAAVLIGALTRAARGGSWKRLPGAAAEADDVTAALGKSQFGPVVSYVGAQALEDVFKRQRAPRVLHIATHGYFFDEEVPERGAETGSADRGLSGSSAGYARLREAENPLLRSGIVLAGANRIAESSAARESLTKTAQDAPLDDGWLTAEEISTLDLRGTELVVLSACETGLGDVKDHEGVQGLRRAFLHAGAATIVTSLYKVPDDATHQLMQTFYGALRDGQPKLQALHTAQTTALKTRRAAGGAAHPYFWGSFILVGQPN